MSLRTVEPPSSTDSLRYNVIGTPSVGPSRVQDHELEDAGFSWSWTFKPLQMLDLRAVVSLTKSESDTVSRTGMPAASKTLVPLGEFSSTCPSSDVALTTGRLASTGRTMMVSLAVVKRFASDTSSAWKWFDNYLDRNYAWIDPLLSATLSPDWFYQGVSRAWNYCYWLLASGHWLN